jgi:hypothetical protein
LAGAKEIHVPHLVPRVGEGETGGREIRIARPVSVGRAQDPGARIRIPYRPPETRKGGQRNVF